MCVFFFVQVGGTIKYFHCNKKISMERSTDFPPRKSQILSPWACGTIKCFHCNKKISMERSTDFFSPKVSIFRSMGMRNIP